MELNIFKRSDSKKGTTKKLRAEGKIPAVIYDAAGLNEKIYIERAEFDACLRKLVTGRLPTTVFKLKEGKKTFSTIIKDIQYHLTTYDVIHMDFEKLQDDNYVNVNVPIVCVGEAECVGVKLGGFLRQIIRYLKVRCLPKNIPQEFQVDITNLNISEKIRLNAIEIPKGIKPLGRMDEVAISIGKR